MFLLTDTRNRETAVTLFKTKEAAQKTMENEYNHILNKQERDNENDDECELCDGYAWINDGPNHDDCDWMIYDIDKLEVHNEPIEEI